MNAVTCCACSSICSAAVRPRNEGDSLVQGAAHRDNVETLPLLFVACYEIVYYPHRPRASLREVVRYTHVLDAGAL
jgi:hypothetical protein